MPISFGISTNLDISGNLGVGGNATVANALTLSGTTASTLLYGNASKAVSSVTLASNLSLTTGTLALAAALTDINSVTAASGQALTLTGGSTGASLVLGSGAAGNATISPGATGQFVVNKGAANNQPTFTGSSSGSGFLLNVFSTPTSADERLFFIGMGSSADIAKTRIEGFAAAAWTSGVSTPTYLSFTTTPTGSTSHTERARITSTGNLLIGTTTDIAAYKLNVYGATSANVIAANGVTPDGTKIGGTFSATLGGTGAASGAYALTGDIAGKFIANAYGNNFIYEAGAIQSTITTGGNADRNLHVAALDFLTKPTGSNTPVTVFRLTGTGNGLLGTTTDISGSGNLAVAGGTVTAGAAATNLTLSGGSSGASLVLGSGANSPATITTSSAASKAILVLSTTDTGNSNQGIALTNAQANAASRNWAMVMNNAAFGDFALLQSNARLGDPILAGTSALTVSAARNLLIGTTTDMASTSGGLTVAATGSGATATGVNTGGLRSANFGLSTVSGGSSYFGGAVYTATSSRASTGFVDTAGTTGLLFNTTTNQFYSGGALITSIAPGGVSIGITTPSTGLGTGALQVAGGIYAGAASVFGSTVGVSGAVRDITSGDAQLNINSTTTFSQNYGGTIQLGGAYTGTTVVGFAGIRGSKESAVDGETGGQLEFFTRSTGGPMTRKAYISSTGAATFAGAVTAPSLTGATNLTLSGGSSGASLVLGSGVNGTITATPAGTGIFSVKRGLAASATGTAFFIQTTDATSFGLFAELEGSATSANRYATLNSYMNGDTGRDLVLNRYGGNILIGTTSTMASTTGGLTVAATGSGATATGVNTGGLRSANFGLSTVSGGASYFGGTLIGVQAGSGAATVEGARLTNTTTTGAVFLNFNETNSAATPAYLIRYGSTHASKANVLEVDSNGAGAYLNLLPITKIANTTTATNTTSGALVVGSNIGLSGNAGGASYFGGNVTAGGSITAGGGLTVSGSTSSFGGASRFDVGLLVVPTALAFPDQFGFASSPTFTSAATTSGAAGYFKLTTAAAAYTMASGRGVLIDPPTLGAGSSITDMWGLRILNQGAAGITNAYGIDIVAQSGAATTNIGLRNAGITSLTNSTPSTGVGTGALQVAGGIYAGADSYFAGKLTQAISAGTIAQSIVHASPTSGVYQEWKTNSTTDRAYIGTGNQVISGGSIADFAINSVTGNVVLGTASAARLTLSSTSATFAGAVTSNGNLTVSGAATSAGVLTVRNTATGVADFGRFQLGNNTSATLLDVYAFSSGYSAGVWEKQNGIALLATGAGGMSLGTSNASGDLRIFAAGLAAPQITVTGTSATFAGAVTANGLFYPQQATTAGAPAYVKGAIYFDTTLNKLRVGGASAWETITSV